MADLNASKDKFTQNVESIIKKYILTYLKLYQSEYGEIPNDLDSKINVTLIEATKKAFKEYYKENTPNEQLEEEPVITFGSETSEEEEPIIFSSKTQDDQQELEDDRFENSASSANEVYDEQKEEQKQGKKSNNKSNNFIPEEQTEEQDNESSSENCTHDEHVEEQTVKKTDHSQNVENDTKEAFHEEQENKWILKAKPVKEKKTFKVSNIQGTNTDYSGRDIYERPASNMNCYKQERTKYDCLVCDCKVFLLNKNHGTPACRQCLDKLNDIGWVNGICFFHFSSCHECSYGEKCNKWHGQKDKDGPIPYWQYEIPDLRK